MFTRVKILITLMLFIEHGSRHTTCFFRATSCSLFWNKRITDTNFQGLRNHLRFRRRNATLSQAAVGCLEAASGNLCCSDWRTVHVTCVL